MRDIVYMYILISILISIEKVGCYSYLYPYLINVKIPFQNGDEFKIN